MEINICTVEQVPCVYYMCTPCIRLDMYHMHQQHLMSNILNV